MSIKNDLYTGKRSIDFIGRRWIWFGIGLALMAISFAAFAFKGFNLGIEFRGGSQFTVTQNTSACPEGSKECADKLSSNSLDQSLAGEVLRQHGQNEPPRVSAVGANGLRIQTGELSETQTQEVRQGLAKAYKVDVKDVTTTYIGPSWGQDVLGKALKSLIIFIVLIMIILTAYFRTWTMGMGALIALFHDLVVTAGVYIIVGFEVTPATVIGLLTILGYSLYDTVVVFDKMRENTQNIEDQDVLTYEEASNLAVNQTLVRSINTSVTGILPVAAVLFIGSFLLGAGTLRDIALALFVGMILSTLSSVFIAVPCAVELQIHKASVAEHTRYIKESRAEAGQEVTGATAVSQALENANAELVAGAHQGNKARPKKKKKGGRK